jgi:hypothetical protein
MKALLVMSRDFRELQDDRTLSPKPVPTLLHGGLARYD